MLTKNIWSQVGSNPANALLPPVHNLGVIILREELTDAESDLHAARVALKTLEEAGASGVTSDLYTAMWKLQKREQAYFARRYLQTNKAVLRGWHNQVSKYQSSGEKVGHGVQGVVYGVINHPDKVVKRFPTFSQMGHTSITTRQFIYDKTASDNGFGPKIYEISSNDRVVDLSDKSTVPKFHRGRIFSVVMERLAGIEMDKQYVGIVHLWKKMRQHGLFSGDGFYGYSLQHKAIVHADFGAVWETKNDEEFKDAVYQHLEERYDSGGLEPGIARRYADEFPEDPFTRDILVSVLANLGI